MRAISAYRLRTVAAAACAAAAHVAGAQQFSVSPVVIEMSADARPTGFSAMNEGTSALVLQVQAQSWTQRDGNDDVAPTRELIVVPPIARIEPGARQLFRVGLRNPAAEPVERTFRIRVEDVTRRTDAAGSIGMRFAHNMPVLVAPAGPIREKLRWSLCSAPVQQVCLQLVNAGNRRVKVSSVLLPGSTQGAQEQVVLDTPKLLLAGTSRELRLPAPRQLLHAGGELQVQLAEGPLVSAEPVRELAAGR